MMRHPHILLLLGRLCFIILSGGDCLELQKLIPKGDYSLVIADIPYGFNHEGSTFDENPFTYQNTKKLIRQLKEVSIAPIWRIVIFHSSQQAGQVEAAHAT